jgi:hypothetical protein
MVPEAKINEFVSRLRQATGDNLVAVVLYGSAAAGDYVDEHSDVNLLCVLRETRFAAVRAVCPAIAWWTDQKHRMPLVMGVDELSHSADVFSIELLDMQQSYRVLWGEDLLKTLVIPSKFHRVQLEYELREKTILLRQGLLSAGNEQALWELMLRSLPAFATLLRHALLELGEPAEVSKRDAVEKLGRRIGIDATAFLELLDIREHKKDRKSMDVNDLCARYLKTVEQVTSAVDKMLDSSVLGSGRA